MPPAPHIHLRVQHLPRVNLMGLATLFEGKLCSRFRITFGPSEKQFGGCGASTPPLPQEGQEARFRHLRPPSEPPPPHPHTHKSSLRSPRLSTHQPLPPGHPASFDRPCHAPCALAWGPRPTALECIARPRSGGSPLVLRRRSLWMSRCLVQVAWGRPIYVEWGNRGRLFDLNGERAGRGFAACPSPPPSTPPQGCIRRGGTSEAAPEAVRQAVGGGCQSGWGAVTVCYICH